MARIKITDLPLLQDLTEEQLKDLFGAGPRSYKPSFDALEDRQLMSGVNLLTTLTSVQRATVNASTPQTRRSICRLSESDNSGDRCHNNAVLQPQIDASLVYQQDPIAQQRNKQIDQLIGGFVQPTQNVLTYKGPAQNRNRPESGRTGSLAGKGNRSGTEIARPVWLRLVSEFRGG